MDIELKSSKNGELAIPLRPVVAFLLATVITGLVLDFVPTLNWNSLLQDKFNKSDTQSTNFLDTYAIYGLSKNEDHLKHVINVLEWMGYRRVGLEENWKLLWAHDYPFLTMPKGLKNLNNEQLVNHIPGCGFITNKVDLSTSPLPFLPKAFRLPSQKIQLLEYSRQNPKVLFVEKHNAHRHIAVRSAEEINFDSNDTFIQEFIQNPFLVDGYKFDMGVYVVITSVNPLRIYIYSGDVLFRYCPIKYYPFNATNVDKYVVGDDYLPTWKVPSLTKYYSRLGGSMRAAFDAYVRDQNMNPRMIWTQIEDIVRRTILDKEQDIVRIQNSYKTRNFFDLLRFDFIIDDTLKVYLMEANMSPNLSSAHFKPNSLLYEQILYSALNLLGIGSPIRKSLSNDRSDTLKEVVTSEQNIATNLNVCAELGCDKYCDIPQCDLCLPCLSGSEYEMLSKAHSEHLHKGNMKRIYPKPILEPDSLDIKTEVQNMTKRNAWMTRWFYHKCVYDNSWCK